MMMMMMVVVLPLYVALFTTPRQYQSRVSTPNRPWRGRAASDVLSGAFNI
jgi:hypothetical protein